MADPGVNIRISTSAELAALQRTERELIKQISAARATGKAYGDLERDLAGVQRRLAQAGAADRSRAELEDFARQIPGVGGALGALQGNLGAIGAALAGATAAYQVASRAVSEYAAAQEKVAGLDAALAQNGQLTDDYRERLQALAGQMQATTAIADDEWLAVLTTLTKFGADSSNIERYTQAVADFAGFLGGDVNQAAFLFGKAMQGSTEMLGRYGIQVDKSASLTQQLDSIMAQLAQRGGGQLEARAGTLAGQWRTLGNNSSDLLEALGRLADKSGLLMGALDQLNLVTSWWANLLGGPIDKTKGLSNNLVEAGLSAEASAQALKEYGFVLDGISSSSDAVTTALQAQTSEIDAQARHTRDLARATKELALQQLEGDTSLSAEERAKRRAAIEEQFRQTELSAEIAAASNKVAAREKAISQLEEASAQRLSDLSAKRAAKEAADQALEDARLQERQIKSIEQRIEAQKAALAKADTLVETSVTRSGPMGAVADPRGLQMALEAQKAAQETLAALEAQKASIGQVAAKAQIIADTETKQYEEQKERVAKQEEADRATIDRFRRENASDQNAAGRKKEIASVEAQTAKEREAAAIKAARDQDARIEADKAALSLQVQLNKARSEGNASLAEALDYQIRYNSELARGATPEQAAVLAAGGRAPGTPGSSALPIPTAAPTRDPVTGTAGGDLFPDSNRRRGGITSDTFEQPVGIGGGSAIDAFRASQNTAPGARQGQSPLGQAAAKQDSAAEANNAAASQIESAAAKMESAATSIAGAMQKLVTRLAKVESQVKSISEKA